MSSEYKLSSLEAMSEKLTGQQAVIYGQVSDDIEIQGNMSIFTLYADKIESNGIIYYTKYKVKVIDYRNKAHYIVPYNYVVLDGEIKENGQYKNIGAFDYKKNQYKDDICGVLIPYYSSDIVSDKCGSRIFLQFFYKLKINFEKILDKYLNDESFKMMNGILFGDTGQIDEEQYKRFQESGIVHVFAVSGYNIWLIYFILSIIIFLPKRYEKSKTIIIIILLGIYTMISGASSSVMRAYIMVAVTLFGKVLKRGVDPLTCLSFAGLSILFYNPLGVWDTGFQLSFAATLSIILLLPKLSKVNLPVNKRIKDLIMLTMAVQIGIIPIIIANFNNLPLFTLLSNVIIIPLISAITIMGIGLCIFGRIWYGISELLGSGIEEIVSAVLHITDFISAIPYSTINITSLNAFEILLYYVIIAILFGFIKINKSYVRKLEYLFLVIVLSYVVSGILPTPLTINIVDVGQGDCILITTPDRKHILIDGGGKPDTLRSSIDIGEDVVKPYLLKHRIDSLDMVISTHIHDDHFKGLIPVLNSFETGRFVIGSTKLAEGYNEVLMDIPVDRSLITKVGTGDVIKVGKYVDLIVLNPSGEEIDENDSSIVLKLIYDDFSMLLTGDISSDVEKRLKAYDINSDILKVPHHGSGTSLDIGFLDKVNPKAAVICVGNNNFGHPSKITIDKLNDKKALLYRTDIEGEIIITTKGGGFTVNTAIKN